MMYLPWATEITDFTPLIMVIFFYRGRGRGRSRGNRGRREWLQGRPMEGSNGDFGRGNGRDNNQRTQPITSTSRSQPVRQDDEWLVPPAVERRDNVGR